MEHLDGVLICKAIRHSQRQADQGQQLAEELGVRHVLEESVQKVGSRVRINVQFIDTESGGHLWAERRPAQGWIARLNRAPQQTA